MANIIELASRMANIDNSAHLLFENSTQCLEADVTTTIAGKSHLVLYYMINIQLFTSSTYY